MNLLAGINCLKSYFVMRQKGMKMVLQAKIKIIMLFTATTKPASTTRQIKSADTPRSKLKALKKQWTTSTARPRTVKSLLEILNLTLTNPTTNLPSTSPKNLITPSTSLKLLTMSEPQSQPTTTTKPSSRPERRATTTRPTKVPISTRPRPFSTATIGLTSIVTRTPLSTTPLWTSLPSTTPLSTTPLTSSISTTPPSSSMSTTLLTSKVSISTTPQKSIVSTTPMTEVKPISTVRPHFSTPIQKIVTPRFTAYPKTAPLFLQSKVKKGRDGRQANEGDTDGDWFVEEIKDVQKIGKTQALQEYFADEFGLETSFQNETEKSGGLQKNFTHEFGLETTEVFTDDLATEGQSLQEYFADEFGLEETEKTGSLEKTTEVFSPHSLTEDFATIENVTNLNGKEDLIITTPVPFPSKNIEIQPTPVQPQSFTQFQSIDCGDKTCFLETRVMPTCIIYLPTPSTDCSIPCRTQNCQFQVKHFVECPVWNCIFKPVTLSPLTTTAPMPDNHNGTWGWLIASLTLNSFFVALFGFAVYKIVQYRQQFRARARQPTTEDAENQGNQRPIIRHDPNFSLSESDPLLSRHNSSERINRNSLLEQLRQFEWQRFRWRSRGANENDRSQIGDVENDVRAGESDSDGGFVNQNYHSTDQTL